MAPSRSPRLLAVLGVISLVGLLPAAIASGSCGGGEGASLTVTPESVKFSGVGSTATLTTQNAGFAEVTIEVFVNSGFKLSEPSKCTKTYLGAGKSCNETVKCVTAGAEGSFLAITGAGYPPASDSAVLKC